MELTRELAATVAQIIPLYLGAVAITVSLRRRQARKSALAVIRPYERVMEKTISAYEAGSRGQDLLDARDRLLQEGLSRRRLQASLKAMRRYSWHGLALLLFLAFQAFEVLAFLLCLTVLGGAPADDRSLLVVLIAAGVGLVSLGVSPFITVAPGFRSMWRTFRSYTQWSRILRDAEEEAASVESAT